MIILRMVTLPDRDVPWTMTRSPSLIWAKVDEAYVLVSTFGFDEREKAYVALSDPSEFLAPSIKRVSLVVLDTVPMAEKLLAKLGLFEPQKSMTAPPRIATPMATPIKPRRPNLCPNFKHRLLMGIVYQKPKKLSTLCQSDPLGFTSPPLVGTTVTLDVGTTLTTRDIGEADDFRT